MILYQIFLIDKKETKTILSYLICTFLIAPTQDILDNLDRHVSMVKLYQRKTTLLESYAHLLLSKGKKLIDF